MNTKTKIQELKEEYEKLIKTISNNKLTPYSAGHCDALNYVVKDLEELLKWYQKQRFKN